MLRAPHHPRVRDYKEWEEVGFWKVKEPVEGDLVGEWTLGWKPEAGPS